jgi:hypothetical protein
VALALACALVALSPRAAAGFFYHSWMAALVHLVTLGWITLSILGAIYIVSSVALRTTISARRGDYVAYALALIGIVGMVAHFWLEEFSGMAWSAATVTLAVLYVAGRFVGVLRASKTPAAVKLHIVFACLNVVIATVMGVLLAFDKVWHFLPGFVLSNVFAHAHMAAIGWATMMVVGVGYRLIPMILPAKPPEGRGVFVSAILLEAGVLGLFASLLVQNDWGSRLFGVMVVSGLVAFGCQVVSMIRSPRPKPAGAPALDFAVLHAASAGISLMLAAALGLTLLFAPPSEWRLRAAAAYGAFGLLGFLSQMVVGMEARLLPMFAWYHAFARSGFQVTPMPPLAMRDRRLQAIVFGAWLFGVPAIASGLGFDSVPWLAAGAWALLAGVLVATIDNVFVLSRAFTAAPTG